MALKHERLAVLVIATLTALGGCSGPAEVSDAGTDPTDAQPPVEDADTTPPDTGLPPECDPGERRTAECGFCGTESQSCEGPGRWLATSECLGQGECAVGDVETRVGELCTTEQRICLDGCAWSDWEETRGPGSCEPGETRRAMSDTCDPGERLLEECSETCEWIEGIGTCVDACGGAPARTSPAWAREVCVPDGDFIRGEAGTRWEPETAIYISSFYIDVYPVTYRRYQQCVDAGACPAPSGTYSRADDPAYLDYPVQGVSALDGEAFCAWDGGRRLPTAAEWEKAARGPAPRTNDYPWGEELDCSIVNTGGEPCRATDAGGPGTTLFASDPYDAFPPTSASYYGVHLMGFGVAEILRDRNCRAPAEPDPVCTDTPYGRMTAGGFRREPSPVYDQMGLATRYAEAPFYYGVRCVRGP